MDTEHWKAVVEYEGCYEVSDLGRVRSKDRWHRTEKWAGKVLSPGRQTSGHLFVNLSRENRTRTRRVHRLVLEAFIGPAPAGMQTRHLDGDPTNNHLANLVWGTILENARDRIRHGRSNKGERHGIAKLTDEAVRAMRRLRQSTRMTYATIGQRFSVSRRTAARAIIGESWSHI